MVLGVASPTIFLTGARSDLVAASTVMGTRKMNGIEPQAHIADDWTASPCDEPMPWNWQAPLDFGRLVA